MLKELYSSLPSFSEERFVTNDPLSEAIVQTIRDPICLNIPNILCNEAPGECKLCQQLFCAHCLEMILKSDAKCPNCREYLQVKKMNSYLKTIVLKLSIQCHFQPNGCPEAFPIEELIKHEAKCEYDTVKCPNACDQTVLKKFVKEHTESECPKLIVKCKYQFCLERLPKAQMPEHEAVCKFKVNAIPQKNQNIEEEEEKSIQPLSDAMPQISNRSNLDSKIALVDPDDQPPKPIKYGVIGQIDKPQRQPSEKFSFSYKQLIKCKNPGCYYTAPEERLQAHEQICSYKIYACKYASKGCEYKNNKFSMMGHEGRCEFGPRPQHNEGGSRRMIFSGAQEFGYKPSQMDERVDDSQNQSHIVFQKEMMDISNSIRLGVKKRSEGKKIFEGLNESSIGNRSQYGGMSNESSFHAPRKYSNYTQQRK